jgi:hypothetical protein
MAQTVAGRNQRSLPRASRRGKKTRKLMKLLDTWLADESGYDERVWPTIEKALEENRDSIRRRLSG